MNEKKVHATLQYINTLKARIDELATALECTARASRVTHNLEMIGLKALLNEPEAEEKKEETKIK